MNQNKKTPLSLAEKLANGWVVVAGTHATSYLIRACKA